MVIIYVECYLFPIRRFEVWKITRAAFLVRQNRTSRPLSQPCRYGPHYICQMFESVDGLEECSVPANKKMFVIDEQSPRLNEGERKRFHTLVVKLLFLSKRAHPEISTSNGFLCIRVTKATKEDEKKLSRLRLKPKDLRLLA